MKKTLVWGATSFFALALFAVTATTASAATNVMYYPMYGNPYAYTYGYPYAAMNYQYTFNGESYDARSLEDLEDLLQELVAYLSMLRGQNWYGYGWQGGVSGGTSNEIRVVTRSADNVTDFSARLRGEVTDFGSSNYAEVWFEFGRAGDTSLTRTSRERLDDDEDTFDQLVGGLREDTSYRFRAVGRDDDGDVSYGTMATFTTDDDWNDDDDDDDNDRDDEPEAETMSADDVEDDRATLRGSVDMNDFNNGEAFFVYGEDEDAIDDIDDDFDSYSDVDEDSDDLQKVLVEDSLDDDDSFEEEVTGLDDDTDYFYRMCVGYEDEDDDDRITCGDVRNFRTDD